MEIIIFLVYVVDSLKRSLNLSNYILVEIYKF